MSNAIRTSLAHRTCGRSRCRSSRTRFSDLSLQQRIGVLALVSVQLGLLIGAEIDIQRRAPEEVNGRKLGWRVACLLNFVGPIAYFRWGRRRVAG